MNAANHDDSAGVIAHPPVLYLGALFIGLGADWLLALPPLPYLPGATGLAAAIVLGPLGLGLLFTAAFRFIKAGTNIPTHLPSTALVTDGLYRYSRNPIYLGLTLVYLGLVAGLASLGALVLLLPLIATMQVGVIHREERYLERKFGDDYRAYKQRVRRWL